MFDLHQQTLPESIVLHILSSQIDTRNFQSVIHLERFNDEEKKGEF